jgi:hypothetical protein
MMFAIVPFVPEIIEVVVAFGGFWSWGYIKGRKKRRF